MQTTTQPHHFSQGSSKPGATRDLDALAAGAKVGRNRAVDLYRAVAMLAVAVGHWVAMVAFRSEGELITGNALEFGPSFSAITWILQVMPLFFMVGGFASAASLDSKFDPTRSAFAQRSDWTAARLARLLPPVKALATTWLVVLGIGYLMGVSALVNAAAVAAAIPLWFLANYTADVVIAPHVLPLFRRSPGKVAAGAVGLFVALEVARLAGDQVFSQLNWILGWFLFQMAGFAWRDGLLPKGRSLAVLAVGLWIAAFVLVTAGPWPVTMVGFHGIAHNPTHPPTLALLVFGAAQSASAIYFAPRVTAWLERTPLAWKSVVGANSFAMTVYLWHMTAAVLVLGALDATGLLSGARPGTAGWWLAKIPFIALCVAVLGLIVPRLSKIERAALLSPKGQWPFSPTALLIGAVLVSVAIKAWTAGSIAMIIPSLVVVIASTKFLTTALRTTEAE